MGILIRTKELITRCFVDKHLLTHNTDHLFEDGNANRSLSSNFQDNSQLLFYLSVKLDVHVVYYARSGSYKKATYMITEEKGHK